MFNNMCIFKLAQTVLREVQALLWQWFAVSPAGYRADRAKRGVDGQELRPNLELA